MAKKKKNGPKKTFWYQNIVWGAQQNFLERFEKFWDICKYFGACCNILDHFKTCGNIVFCWVKHFWSLLDRFGKFCNILESFGVSLTFVGDFLIALDNFGEEETRRRKKRRKEEEEEEEEEEVAWEKCTKYEANPWGWHGRCTQNAQQIPGSGMGEARKIRSKS